MFRKIFIKVNTARYGCSNFNPSDIIEPKAKSSSSSSSHDHHKKNPSRPIVTSSSSTSSREKANSTTSFSLNTTASLTCSDHDFVSSKLRDSVAILKESKDPFLDFRRSMLEMIYENEIYSKDELRELLDLFLELNSACYHRVIVKAFMEIWNCVFSSREACESIEFHPGNLHGGN
ncbi:hypothetical protein LIER_30203 [Lithospermum erythrorhizon]|uniref:Transcription repressor n=1 Tax=Lithospermum erythrorhizon TaxID=34254 RepID=A0AAV3RLY2_LITER